LQLLSKAQFAWSRHAIFQAASPRGFLQGPAPLFDAKAAAAHSRAGF